MPDHQAISQCYASHSASLHRATRVLRPVKIQPLKRPPRSVAQRSTAPALTNKRRRTDADGPGFDNGGLTLGIGGLLLGIGGALFGASLAGALGVAVVVLSVVLGLVVPLFGLTAFAFNDTGASAHFNAITLLGILLAGGGLASVLGVAFPVAVPGLGLLLLAAGLIIAGIGMLH